MRLLEKSFGNVSMLVVNRNFGAENAASAIDVAKRKLCVATHNRGGFLKLDCLDVPFEVAFGVRIYEASRVFRIVASAECAVAGFPDEFESFVDRIAGGNSARVDIGCNIGERAAFAGNICRDDIVRMCGAFIGASVEFLYAGVVELGESLGEDARLACYDDSGNIIRNIEFAHE